MNDQSRREEALFEAALKFPSAEARAAFVEGACGDDELLRQRVGALLQAHDEAGIFLEHPPSGVRPSPNSSLTVAEPLTEKTGEEGCGVVYVAEQEEPVRRRVALKVIKLGMDTKSVIARFEAERQALEHRVWPDDDLGRITPAAGLPRT